MSFADIMNAAEDAANQFEGDKHSLSRWPGPSFSAESFDMEYSFAIKLSNDSSSPQLEEDCKSTGSSRVYTQEVIVFSVNSDEDEEVDNLH